MHNINIQLACNYFLIQVTLIRAKYKNLNVGVFNDSYHDKF